MRLIVALPVAALVTVFATSALAADPVKEAPKDAAKSEAKPQGDAPEGKLSLSAAAAPVLPVGNLSDGFSFGLGAVVGADYAVLPRAAVIARVGFIHHLPKTEVSLEAIPVWVGGRYSFLDEKGPYAEAALGPTVLIASATVNGVSASDNRVKVGAEVGGGYRFGKVDLGARAVFYDLGNAGDSAGVMATAGFAFASF
jgi:hypothetical protein